MKRLFEIILPVIGKGGVVKYIFIGLLSGLSSFLFINTVTRVVGLLMTGSFTVISTEYLIIFSAIILLYIWSRRTLALIIIDLSQRITWKLRKQILSQVLNATFEQLSGRRNKLQAAILSDVGALTNASMGIIDFFIALIMAFSCFIYLASISVILFGITLFVALLGVAVYYFTTKVNTRGFEKARTLENKFQENFNAILDGFKEICMEPAKGRYIFKQKIHQIAEDSFRHNVTALTGFLNSSITGQVLFYILISAVLLCFSVWLQIKPGDTVSFVFTLIYLLSSIQTIMVLLPTLARAGVATNHLVELEQEMAEADLQTVVENPIVFDSAFDSISVRDLAFSYNGTGFGIGPIQFDINRGEIIFIYGGNGSGKTTFLHTVLGLCTPSAGTIRLNEQLIEAGCYTAYRAMFGVVFSDFYLFPDILEEHMPDAQQWNDYLQLFELEGKVTLDGNIFSTTELSTGQRKRLALIAVLLEAKPILVLDEWAADQDPYFRRKFYTEILPMLKQRGTTVIAITHDDKYYHCADRLYKMEEGKLYEEDLELHRVPMLAASQLFTK